MTYANANMKNGDLIFRHGTNLIDTAIEIWEGSPFSHCGVIQVASDGTLGVLQAVSKSGVYVIAMDGFLSQGACVWMATGVDWTPDVQAKANALIGKPYSAFADFEVGIGLAPADDQYNCSLLCGDVMGFCGIQIPRAGLTPKALAAFFVTKGCAIEPT